MSDAPQHPVTETYGLPVGETLRSIKALRSAITAIAHRVAAKVRCPILEQAAGWRKMRIMAAAILYFAVVFSVGFLLGPIRVLWLEPQLGPSIAALCEAPFLLIAMAVAALWVLDFVRLRQAWAPLALMGGGALVLQQLADFAVGISLRGLTPSEQLARFSSAPGLIYAGLLVAFAAMPVVVNLWADRR
jgi:hypothetical protein